MWLQGVALVATFPSCPHMQAVAAMGDGVPVLMNVSG